MGRATDEIKNILRGKFFVGKDAFKSWMFVGFLFVLIIIVITSSQRVDAKVHLIDQKIYTIAKLETEVKELRSEFVDVRSRLQKVRLESSLLEQLESKGLKQPEKPPQKIKVIVEE